MRKFTLYRSNYSQNAQNADYPHKEEIASLQDLLRVAQSDHIFSAMKDNHRATDNFISTDGFILDLDNTFTDEPEEWKNIDDITETFPDVMFYYVESRNHMKGKRKTNSRGVTTYEEPRPKYHLYFPLSRTITDHEEIKKLILEAAGLYCYMDLASAEPQHMFFGVIGAKGGEIDGSITIDEYMTGCGDNLQTMIKDNLDEYEKNIQAGLYKDNTETKKAISRLNIYIGRQPAQMQVSQYVDSAENSADNPIGWIEKEEQRKSLNWLERWASANNVSLGKRYKVNTKAHPGAIVICVKCPWEEEHSMNGAENESVIIIDAGGQYHYLCRHGHGAGLSWKKYREKIEAENPDSIRINEGWKSTKAQTTESTPTEADNEQTDGAGIDAFLSKIQTREFEPIPTGIKALDNALRGGFTRKTLVMFGAAPGMGKTMLAQWVFENMAAAGNDVLYLNLEMSREQLLARSISRLAWKYEKADISALDVLRGYAWTDTQREIIGRTAERYKKEIAGHFIYNPESVRNNKISSILSAMQTEADRLKKAGRPAPVVCIDYLQLIDTENRDATEGMKNVIALLKDFALNNSTVVLAIIANNRTSNKAGAADMESGRDTSAIEYCGDAMLGLVYTAIEDKIKYEAGETKKGETIYNTYDLEEIRRLKTEAYRKKAPLPDVCREITLKVNKNRLGEDAREARLVFDGAHSTFTTKEDADDIKQNPFIPGGAKQVKRI